MTSPAGPVPGGMPPGTPAVCVRHADRPTALSCTRCERPACPDCLRDAAVGYHCVDCVADGRRGLRRATTLAGAEPAGRPIVVPVLVVLNVVLFAITAVQAGSIASNDDSGLFEAWALWWVPVAESEWWRVLTTGFLHFGPLHLLINMLVLWLLGRELEVELGRWRFTAVYLLALFGGSAAVLLVGANVYVAGASGAVFGVAGGLVVARLRLGRPLTQIVVLLVLNLAIGLYGGSNSSVEAHVGGLIVGALATAVLVHAPSDRRRQVQVGGLVAVAAVTLGVIVLAGAQII